MALLLVKKINISEKYTDFLDIFFKKSAAVFVNCLDINEYKIDLKPDKQLPYKQIYSLCLVKLKIFKAYIKANFANRFIQLFKIPIEETIFCIWKFKKNFCLYINYCNLNNLTIKN